MRAGTVFGCEQASVTCAACLSSADGRAACWKRYRIVDETGGGLMFGCRVQQTIRIHPSIHSSDPSSSLLPRPFFSRLARRRRPTLRLRLHWPFTQLNNSSASPVCSWSIELTHHSLKLRHSLNMSICTRSSSAQRLWLSATTRLCHCYRSVPMRLISSTYFSSFAFLSRVSKPKPAQHSAKQQTTAQLTTPPSRPAAHSGVTGGTTLMPDSSSPYMQEDATLERVALVGYGPDHFEVFNPSSLSQSSTAQSGPSQRTAASTAAGADGDEEDASSVPVTASVVASVAAPATRSGVLSRGVFSAPNTISMFGGVIALPTAAVSSALAHSHCIRTTCQHVTLVAYVVTDRVHTLVVSLVIAVFVGADSVG